MPAIRQYRQQYDPPLMESPRARTPNIGNELAQGFEVLGRGAQDLAFSMKERDEENARAWASSILSNARLTWTQHLIDRQQTAEPDARDFTPNFVKDYDEYANKTIEAAPTHTAKKYLTERLGELRSQLGTQALHFEAQARVDWRTDQFNTAINNTEKLMNTDSRQYPVALAERLAEIDGSALPPLKKSALRQQAVDKISVAAVWSQIQKDPGAFLDGIGFVKDSEGKLRKSSGDLAGATGNMAFDALPFDKRVMLFGQAVQQKAQLDADAERLVKERQAKVSDDAMKEAWGRLASGKLSRSYVESIRPLIKASEYHSILTAMKSAGEGGPKTDSAAFRELLLLQGTDPKAAEQFAFTIHRNGRLSNSDLVGEVNRVRTILRQEGPKSEYERSRNYITQSMDPGPFVQDPVGKQRFAEATRMFDEWYQQGPGGRRPDAEMFPRSQEIVRQFKLVNFNDSVLALPMPRGIKMRRSNDPNEILQDAARAAAELEGRRNRGKIKQEEFEDELRIIRRWREAAEQAKSAPK